MDRTNLYRTVGVALAAAAVVSLTTVAHAAKPLKFSKRLYVVDSTGAKVGVVHSFAIDHDGAAAVALKVAGETVLVRVGRSLIGSYDESIDFDGPDCTGNALAGSYELHGLYGSQEGKVGGTNWTLYRKDPGASEVSYTRMSSWYQPVYPAGAVGSCTDYGEAGDPSTGIPLIRVKDLRHRYTPPFSLKGK